MQTITITPQVRIHSAAILIAFVAALALTSFAFFGVYPPGDLTIARAVQSVRFPGLEELSGAVYRTGVFPWFQGLFIMAAAVLFVFRQRLMAVFMLLGLLAHNLTFVIKETVERPRPSPAVVDVAHISGGFSFPSGHVVGAVLFWGLIFFAAGHAIEGRWPRLLVQAASVAMIALMGLQRVYAGAHWPTDVVGGYLWGGLMLFGLVTAFTRLRTAGTARPLER